MFVINLSMYINDIFFISQIKHLISISQKRKSLAIVDIIHKIWVSFLTLSAKLIFVYPIPIIYILNNGNRLSRFSSGKPLCSVMNFKIRSFSSSSLVQGQYSASNKRSKSRFFECLFFFSCLAFKNI